METNMSSKERVRRALEEEKGYLSGEKLAADLGISRNAVWKAIEALRKEGCVIDAATRRGYRLVAGSAGFSMEALEPYLDGAVDRGAIHIFRKIPSTSRTAKELALAGAPHGTVILADEQTSGSGHHAAAFYSPAGGIYLSVLMRPGHFPYRDPAAVTGYAAAAVCETLEETAHVSPSIRPVGGIYLKERKICGILTESASDLESGEISWIVAGIGIHYCLDPGNAPPELPMDTGSLYGPDEEIPHGTRRVSREEIAGRLISRLLVTNAGRSGADILAACKKRQDPTLT